MTQDMVIGPDRRLNGPGEAKLATALGWWNALRPADGGLPLKEQFCLSHMPEKLMPYLAVVSGFTADGRLRAEFVGTIASIFGGGYAVDRYVDEIYPPYAVRLAVDILRRVEERRGPLAGLFDLGRNGTKLLTTRRLYLPFAGNDGGIAMFVAVLTYDLTVEGRAQRTRILFQPGLDVLQMELFAPLL